MYLEKLEIQGFKSFANKNVLVFPGMLDKEKRGITSIVGPNGSGKSNVADAVRWSLGEQSMKTLRGKKSEDVIFSGSDKKGKLGMCEVSLFLNNEDHRAPVDFSQIQITRRLYRSGESEYLINNSRTRLSDIQMLLARAKFGQKTYSVIGQGTVEGFLNTTLSERKEFFDEATGVKQYQIKRDDSLNKLHSSYDNLIQAQMLIHEIEPRLKSLTRQVSRLHKRDEIEKELRVLQIDHFSRIWHEISDKFNRYNSNFLELEQTKFSREKKLDTLNRELEQLEAVSGEPSEFESLQDELAQALKIKDELTAKLAKAEAQAEIKLEANGKFDLSFLLNKKEEINKEIILIGEEITAQERHIDVSREKEKELEQDKEIIDSRIESLNKKLAKLGEMSSQGDDQELGKYLEDLLAEIRQAKDEADPEKIRSIIVSLEEKIGLMLEKIKTSGFGAPAISGGDLQEIQEKLYQLTKDKETAMVRLNDNNLRISARTERIKLLKENKNNLEKEVKAIEDKLGKENGEVDMSDIAREQKELREELAATKEKISGINEKIMAGQAQEEKERGKLFALQKEIASAQDEINLLNSKMNEEKINSTRYETKLEDLEIEIRQEVGSLKEVKEVKAEGEADQTDNKEKISQLKRQLELIGGIDPQIEQEYNETKERYDFLSSQMDDFTKAVDSLTKIIKELDITIKERFDKEFKIIAQNFEKYFKVLFNGGSAKIIKVMDEETENEASAGGADGESNNDEGQKSAEKGKSIDMEDAKKIKFLQRHNATGLMGIEIVATPPGKKIKSIAMLSGGERAMTAIALICAIISSNPSPFVVLDEVDAALDEANSERLARILDELSHKTQFIVITHNRASMRRANILYGVTMGDDGISKLLSIKLEEASKHVSR